MDISISNSNIDKAFIWKDKRGNFIQPHEMSTKRLFNTWLMIWNHTAPRELRIWDNHKYVFGSYYTSEYMLSAFMNLYAELKGRDDLGYKSKEVMGTIEANYRETVKEVEYAN